LDAIEHPQNDGARRLPYQHTDSHRDGQPGDRIREWVTEPHADRSGQNRKAGPAVDPGVVAVGDERGASDLSADTDPKDGHAFVAEKADQRSEHDGPEHRHWRGMNEAIDGFVRSDRRTSYDRDENGEASEIFDATQPVGKAAGDTAAGQP